jgi:hypothetical protein
MMDCNDARAFVDSWEQGDEALSGLDEFRAHLDGCRDCSRRFGVLLPLMERDVVERGETTGAAQTLQTAKAAERGRAESFARRDSAARALVDPDGFADDVMKAIGRRQKRVLALSPFAAAAAAAIFALGIGLGIWFGSRNNDMVTVRFALDAPQASSVQLAGDFTSWNAKGYELSRSGPGSTWVISVPLKKGRVYVYNFIVDGTTWIPDPRVPVKVDDGFGGSSSLLRL